MNTQHCGLCGRSARADELIALPGLKGWVCRPGAGCDRAHPALRGLRQWLADPDAYPSDGDLTDLFVDNPPPQK